LLALTTTPCCSLRPAAAGAGEVAIHPLVEARHWQKSTRDSEALRWPTGSCGSAIENSNQCGATPPATSPPRQGGARAIRKWQLNRGTEAMLRFPTAASCSCRRMRTSGHQRRILFLGDPAEPGHPRVPLSIDPRPASASPTRRCCPTAAALPDRGLGLWSGWTARLLVGALPGRGEQADRHAGGRRVRIPAHARQYGRPGVTQEAGRTIVWIASDDNLLALQRTLLLKFEWTG
jgi:hypothetical protein